ncbi:MAG: glycosyltransferase, partial [Candidatus Omnitrophica bacterium]|nr:glycosyltransferase [Candidatus Omnitrophota bacterium]
MRKIKILHLTTDSKIGGTEKNIIALTAHLNKNRYENIVVALKSGGKLIECLKEQGIKGRVLGMKSILDIGRIFRLWKLMRTEKIDILQTWLWHADILGRIIGRLAKVRVIVSSQRCLDLKSPAYKVWLNKLTSLWCDKIICVSNQVRQKLIEREKIEEAKLTVIHTGLEFDAGNNKDKIE